MSSHDTKNPNGGVNMGHVIEPPDPNSNLLELVLFRDNMQLAWKRVKSNKGAPGVDDISIKERKGVKSTFEKGSSLPLTLVEKGVKSTFDPC